MNTVLLWGDPGRTSLLSDVFLRRGLQTIQDIQTEYAPDQMSTVDLFVYALPAPKTEKETCVADIRDWSKFERIYDSIACEYLRGVHRLLPYMKIDARIGVWTDEDSSVNRCQGTDSFGWRMSAAAVNMASMQLFNALRPKGITMRICAAHDPVYAVDCFLRNRSFELDNPLHSDENRLSIRGNGGAEIPW